MSRKAGQAVRELRNILDLTQAEFAAMVGVSKDAVVSWEVGRNKLSRSFARRIAFATGVDEESLLRGGPLRTSGHLGERAAFTAETFARHRSSSWGRSDEAAARHHLAHCADALGLLFRAAVRPAEGKDRKQLPALLASFRQWCEETAVDFGLMEGIESQLLERRSRVELNKSYKQWRANQKEDPEMCRMMGFKDDPKKRDDEYLKLSVETVPFWRPGYSMRAGRGKG